MTNTWHFATASTPASGSEVVAAATNLATFYKETVPNAGIGPYFSRTRSRATNACSIDMSVVTAGSAGEDDDVVSPIQHTELFTLPAISDPTPQDLPDQIAIVLSYEGDLTGLQEEIPGPPPRVRPRARRRGRVWLGPFTDEVLTQEATTFRPIVGTTMRDKILDAAQALATRLAATDQAMWIVYSRSLASAIPVTRVAVDDAFDVIRARKQRRTVKEFRTIDLVVFP